MPEIQLVDDMEEYRKTSEKLSNYNLAKSDLEKNSSNISEQLNQLAKFYNKAKATKAKYDEIFLSEGLDLPDSNYWQQSDEILQPLSPWLFSLLQKIRVELFILSNELIKCTIFANKAKLIQNLNIMNMMSYTSLPTEMYEYGTHIWNSFALVVPVISTTFSSFSSLFKDLGSKEISYLLIDEAGQSSPHKALGAVWRSNKVIVVGDPLQIEPVGALSEEIGEQILKINNIDIKYNPLSSSVQSFADSCNSIGTYVINSYNKVWIGFPLRVHRRCNNPMFKVANQISYDNLMIYKISNKPSSLETMFPESLWIDVQNFYSPKKWIKEEGEITLNIINKFVESKQILPSLFIISPFKDVATHIKSLLINKMIIPNKITNEEKKLWIRKSIGTIHTFQGKEAEMVIIILGCGENSKAAVNWASSKPNILNVALTRAKNLVFIVGNSEIWGRKNYFNILFNDIKLIDHNKFRKEMSLL